MKKTDAERKYDKKCKLYKEQGGFCYYCKKKMRLNEKGGTKITDRTATIEHLYCKGDLRRLCVSPEKKHVLACHKCNSTRLNDFAKYNFIYIDKDFDIRDLLNGNICGFSWSDINIL